MTRVAGESVSLALAAPLKPGDGVVLDAGNPAEREEGGRVYQVEPARSAPGETVLRFGHGDINWSRVRAGQLVWKTNDPALDRELRATFEGEKVRFQRPINLELHGHAGAPLTLIARDAHGHVAQSASALPLAAAENQPLTTERLRDQLGRLGGTPFSL
ncbi:MAG: peptidase U32, partial [Verrucomicrobiales bacterium VVV1]